VCAVIDVSLWSLKNNFQLNFLFFEQYSCDLNVVDQLTMTLSVYYLKIKRRLILFGLNDIKCLKFGQCAISI
jgi:hypothetical protein